MGEATQAGSYATGASYHPNGALAGFTYGNGIVHSQSLNTRQLPLLRRDSYSSTNYTHYTYAYDNNGNVLDITDGTPGALETRDLAYDARDRMTEAHVYNKFGTQTYAYDPLDNLRKVVFGGVLNLDYSYSNNRLIQLYMDDGVGTATHNYGYDARGNMTLRTNGHTHSYDRANRMLTATTPAGTETYRYDGHGRRTTIVRGGNTITQVYGRDGTFLYERTSGGATTKHIHLGGRLVATTSLGTTFYAHTDVLGSVVRKTNPSRVETARTIYEPYGSMGNVGTYTQGPGFTGHVTDQATTLSYMQQRYYDPVAMRFVSVDPVEPSTADGSNFNRYWYANANPYKYVDPDGEFACTGTHIKSVCDGGGVASLQATARTLEAANTSIASGSLIGMIASANEPPENRPSESRPEPRSEKRSGKYEKPPNPNKRPPPEHRRPSGERERNVRPPKGQGEEHSRRPKGGFRPRIPTPAILCLVCNALDSIYNPPEPEDG